MEHRRNEPSMPGRLTVMRRKRPAPGVADIATLLGSAALLAIAQAAPLHAQTNTTDQAQPPAAMVEQPDTQASEPSAPEPTPVEGQIVEQPEGTVQVSKLIGAPVASSEGEEIGEIADVLFGEDGMLMGYVVGIGGFLGFGEKAIAVEAEKVTKTTTADGREQLVLNYTLEELEQSPEFVSLDDQRQAEIDDAAREALLDERQNAEQAQQPQQQEQEQQQPQQQQPATTTVPTE